MFERGKTSLQLFSVVWIPAQKLCIHFVYKICTRCIKLMIQNVSKMHTKVYRILTNIYIHFVHQIKKTMLAKFVCKMYTKILSICAIHFGYNLYTKFIQNVYKNKCMQNESLISTYFDRFVSQTIKTWNLLTNQGKYLSNQWITGLYTALNSQQSNWTNPYPHACLEKNSKFV